MARKSDDNKKLQKKLLCLNGLQNNLLYTKCFFRTSFLT